MNESSPRRLKALQIFPSTTRGGVEEYALAIASGAVRRGHEFHSAFPPAEGVLALRRDLEAAGAACHALEIDDSRGRWITQSPRQFVYFCRTARLLRRLRPGVAHVILPYPDQCLGAVLACAWRRTPAAIVFQLVPPRFYLRRSWRAALRWAHRRNQRWIAISRNNRDVICGAFGVSPAAVDCVYNGVKMPDPASQGDAEARDALRARVRAELGLPETARLLLTVARLEPQKGYEDYAPIIPVLAREFPGAWFVWVGGGSLRQALCQRLKSQGAAERVLFVGYRHDVPRLLDAADLFVFPTRYEGGQSLALTEAMAHGAPIVASRASGIPEAVQDGVHGRLFDVGDSQGLLNAVRAALNAPGDTRRMAVAALARARDFSEEAMVLQTLQIMEALAGTGGR